MIAAAGAWPARAVLLEPPVRPDRDTARRWAEQELLGQEYQEAKPGPVRMLWNWLRARLDDVGSPDWVDARLVLLVVVVILLAVIGYVTWRSGGVHRTARADGTATLFGDAELSADDHRRAAERAEESGDLATAVLERFRAIVRSLADRDLVPLAPGLTADEATRAAARSLPDLADDLAAAARSFDDVRYGDRPASADQVRALRDLDGRAAATRPLVSAR